MARFDDGFATLISLGGTNFWEKTVTPPGVEGGGAVETSTMRNVAWRTKNPKKLKSMTDSSFTAAFASAAYTTILAQINVNQEIVITFPDESTLTFWGWLDSFVPGEFAEGEQPTADCTIICSNQDADGDEIAPVQAAPGP
jgi:hypothetical protein